jgi:molybdopterin converting factor small subunit
MRLNIKYTASFRELTFKNEEKIVTQDDLKLGDLVNTLSQKYGVKFKGLLDNSVILVNAEPGNANITLRDGDYVSFILPVAGG